MTGFAFDANIVIDALAGFDPALQEIERAIQAESHAWISRMAWIEVLSKGSPDDIHSAEAFLTGFDIDEIDVEIATCAAGLRRERARLRSPDAVIMATAMIRGRILVTRNTRDFPVDMPGVRVPYIL